MPRQVINTIEWDDKKKPDSQAMEIWDKFFFAIEPDFDNDGLLTSSDLCKLIDHLTVLTSENHLTVNELKIIVGHVMIESV